MLGGPSFSAVLFPLEFNSTEASQPYKKQRVHPQLAIIIHALRTMDTGEGGEIMHPNEAIMEMHPKQRCRNSVVIGRRSLHSLHHGCLRLRASLGVVIHAECITQTKKGEDEE